MPNAILIYAEHAGGQLAPGVAELVTAARASNAASPIEAALVGSGVAGLVAPLGALGVTTVYTVDQPALASYQVEPYVAALAAIAVQAQPAVILASQTFQVRDLLPRLAFRLDAGVVMDAIELESDAGAMIVIKPMYGGNARARMRITTTPALASVRAKVYDAAPASGGTAKVIVVTASLPPARAVFKQHVVTEGGSGVKLEDARVVVSGGRGLGNAEAFAELEQLAASLGGAVGASRGAVDAGYLPAERQIGLSGKVVSPDLYIAVALSGAAQHMAGCSGAKTIVAINRDEEASIFRAARFGVVGDWKQVLPPFIAKVRELTGT